MTTLDQERARIWRETTPAETRKSYGTSETHEQAPNGTWIPKEATDELEAEAWENYRLAADAATARWTA